MNNIGDLIDSEIIRKTTEEYVRVGTTVTENFLSFGLYKKDGELFDLTEQLFSFDKKGLEWGRKFFQ
jgi:predicted transcriptional regulator